ncbi:MAG TPA: ATPase P [Spirochaetota bacterium]|nr:ATPase P [Spirochaetota bacterium]
MQIIIPGSDTLDIKNLLIDYNGTIAVDGKLLPGVADILNELSRQLDIHVITADTFGFAESELEQVKCTFNRLAPDNQSEAKLLYLSTLGKENTACIGNGKNDRYMLKESALGIAVVQREGVFTETAIMSDIICPDIFSALDLFRNTKRLIATMRD